MDCIEGDTIQTGTALVSEDAANTIRGENPKFTAIGEAPAIMDLIFRSLVPSLDETIKINLHVDLEFQQDYDVSYPAEKRAFFYAVQKVSAQLPKVGKSKEERGVLDFLQRVFSGDQEKVYSYLPDNTADEKEIVDMLTMVDCIEKRGEKRGERRGKQLSQARMQKLILRLAADNKSEDIIRIAKNDEYLEKMYKKYGI